MEALKPAGYIVPNPRIPKVIGILNIVFASGLLICGLCTGLSLVVTPFMTSELNKVQQKAQSKLDSQRKAQITELEEQEKAARSEADKEVLRTQRQQLEAAPPPTVPNMNFGKMGFNDPRMQAYAWTDLATGILLNLAMLTAGIGLVMRKPWSPGLGSWVAVFKIFRLIALYSFFALVLVPIIVTSMVELLETMAKQQAMGGPPTPMPPAGWLGRVYTVMYTAYCMGIIVVGSIYPAITIWLLNKPGARAACSGSDVSFGPKDTW